MKKHAVNKYALAVAMLVIGSSMLSVVHGSIIDDLTATVYTSIDPKIATIIDMVNESLLRGYLEDLVACGPRMTGTYGGEKAAAYLYHQLELLNLETRYHDWASFGNKWNPRFFKSQNVEGVLTGTDDTSEDILIFNAHYDTVKVSPGANDDGSGVAAVLVAAYILSQFEFNRTIKFVAFSGEEIGLLGSRAYAKDLYDGNEDILVDLNADMIGYAETTEGGNRFRMYGTQDVSWIMNDIEQINENYAIDFNLTRGTILPGGHGSGDYASFVPYGYETITFFQGETNLDYFHTPEDSIEHVNFSYLVNTTKLIVGTLAYLADVGDDYPQVTIASPRRGKLYFEGRTLKTFRYEKTIVLDDMLVCAEVEPGVAPIDYVEFYYDGKLAYNDTELPFQWQFNKLSFRRHTIKAVAYDVLGNTASDELEIFHLNLNKKR